MVYLINYQQFKYVDQSDNPALRTWRVTAATPEDAFIQAQKRAISERKKGRRVGAVRRAMHTVDGDLRVAQGDFLSEYLNFHE